MIYKCNVAVKSEKSVILHEYHISFYLIRCHFIRIKFESFYYLKTEFLCQL
ncbi:unnamed protein product [Commensalibacter communis]|nr:unnamed protein product [Commensalibacter communis]